MNKVQAPTPDVGVIVGRFHVDKLHEAHIDLINSVCKEHDKVIIFLGLAHVRGTQNNPLDFECRKQMILADFPDINVLYIKDVKFDTPWAKNLDEQIADIVGPTSSAMLYGSRDCFIEHYTGRYPTTELESEVYISGSQIRKSIGRKVKNTPEFRAGAIWQTYNRYPVTYPTVDVAIFNEDCTKLLMARKEYESKFRFVGGFAEPMSPSYESDARREVAEEASIEVSEPQYVGSFLVDDWRYRNEIDKIKTLFFKTKHVFGKPVAADDIVEVRWFDIDKIQNSDIVDGHVPLLEKLLKNPTIDA